MAILAAHAIAQHGTADHEAGAAAMPAAGKTTGGLEALFSALLAASGIADVKNGENAGHNGLAKDTAAHLVELLNQNTHIVVKTAAAGTDAMKPAAAKDEHAREPGRDDTAQEMAATPVAQLVSIAPAPGIALIKKAPQTPDIQAADGKPQTAADAGNGKDLHTALAALQTHADKAVHQNIPAEKTAEALPLQSVAVVAKADGKGENSSSPDTGRDGTPQQKGQNSADSASAKVTPAPVQAANGNTSAATPDPNAAAPSSPPLQGAPAHVSTTLQITPHDPVHPVSQSGPDNQAVPLSNLAALAVSIAARSEAGTKHFDINLHPAELGSIHVRLSVDHAGLAQAHLQADTPQTLALLQRDSHMLERALKDTGLNLAGNGLNFSLKGQDRESGGGPRTNTRGRTLSLSAIASAAPAGMASIDSLSPDGVRLDIRV